MKNIRSDLDRTYWNTLHRNKEIRTAIRKMLKTYKADYMITINFNRATNFDAAKKILKELQARINRKLFGKWWLRKPVSERTEFVAFVEHPNSNFHYHVLFRLAEMSKSKLLIFRLTLEPYLKSVIASGTVHVSKLMTDEDKARIIS